MYDDEQDPDLWRKQRIEDEMAMEEKPSRFIQTDPNPEYSRLDRLDGLGRTPEVEHDHDPGGCTCGCPVPSCQPCGGDRSTLETTGVRTELLDKDGVINL